MPISLVLLYISLMFTAFLVLFITNSPTIYKIDISLNYIKLYSNENITYICGIYCNITIDNNSNEFTVKSWKFIIVSNICIIVLI